MAILGRSTINAHKLAYPVVYLNDEENSSEDEGKTNDLCGYCFQEIGQGISHKCGKLNRQKNLADLVKNISPITSGKKMI